MTNRDVQIDLRSDTVTKPDEGMREAMAWALVGDDVYGEDPSVNELEERVASLFGFEAAVYMPSGTMTNQSAIRLHTSPGDQVFAAADSHCLIYEGGSAALAGVQITEIGSHPGSFSVIELKEALYEPNLHTMNPALVVIENTHNRSGGRIWNLESMKEVQALSRERGLKLHLDGARIWNASVASNRELKDLVRGYDSVSVCLSKGLGAPVGSLLLISSRDAFQVRKIRKQMGGGMRQAGILARAGLYALNRFLETKGSEIKKDHQGAKKLASGLKELSWVSQVVEPETNIVVWECGLREALELVARAKKEGVLLNAIGKHWLRAVTHRDLEEGWVESALKRIESLN